MKQILFKKINEKVIYEKLDNGIDVYLYKTDKSKNFYCTFSTKYGSKVMKYQKNNNIYDVIPGTAHFLEHKVMNFTTNKEFFNRINKLGSVANAYTTYNITNYNIFGSVNIIENLSLILDMVYNLKINETSVESEKGIITEEIDMDKDDINTSLYMLKNKNLFLKNYPIYHILGEKEDIDKINSNYLKEIYKNFYRPDNMFIIVTGNFEIGEVLKFLKKYMKKHKNINNDKIKIKKIKEPDKVKIEYEKVIKKVSEDKVYYSVKLNKKIFKDINKKYLNYYSSIILSSNFGTTSKLYEKYKRSNLITAMKAELNVYDNHIILSIKASTPDGDEFIKAIEKDINNIYIDEKTFERKKKKLLSELILSFENIEDIEHLITNSILKYNKLYNKSYEDIINLNYKEVVSILKRINFKNKSILICSNM